MGRFTLRAMPRRSRWSATVRRWTPNSRARSFNERPCWYSTVTAATSEGVSRRWTGFVRRRVAPPALGESTSSTSARSALEPGFECRPLWFGSRVARRFEGRFGAFCGFRRAAGSTRIPWSGAVSRVSGGFESRPQRSTEKVQISGGRRPRRFALRDISCAIRARRSGHGQSLESCLFSWHLHLHDTSGTRLLYQGFRAAWSLPEPFGPMSPRQAIAQAHLGNRPLRARERAVVPFSSNVCSGTMDSADSAPNGQPRTVSVWSIKLNEYIDSTDGVGGMTTW